MTDDVLLYIFAKTWLKKSWSRKVLNLK